MQGRPICKASTIWRQSDGATSTARQPFPTLACHAGLVHVHPDCFDSQLLLLSSLRLCFRQQQPVCRQLNQGGLPPAGTQHNGDESGRTCPQAASSASAALLCCNMPVSCQVVCCSLAAGTDWVTCWYIAGAVQVVLCHAALLPCACRCRHSREEDVI